MKSPLKTQITVAQELWAERLKRIADAERRAAQSDCIQQPLRERIGLMQPRQERGGWKEQLEAPAVVQMKDRDTTLDLRILRGEVDDAVRVAVLREEKRIICFLLSSTFTDTVPFLIMISPFMISHFECVMSGDL